MTYKVQIDDQIRDATPEEIARIDAQREAADAHVTELEAKEAAAKSARTKLAALGLTEAEVKALVG